MDRVMGVREGRGKLPIVCGKGESHDWGEDVWELDDVLGEVEMV